MRREKRWRYYCDFCKRSGAVARHIVKHERGCVRNPGRVCGICRTAGLEQNPLVELIAALGEGFADGVERLRTLAEGCPACLFAAIVQSGLQRKWVSEDDPGFRVQWEFRPALEAFWREHNEAMATMEYERERHYG